VRGGEGLVLRHQHGSEDTLLFSQRNKSASMNEVKPLERAAYERMMSGKARSRVVVRIE
jgi:hypothetical protein